MIFQLIKRSIFRGFAAGIYTTNSPEACQYCAENSKANIIVVEDEHQLQKILKVKNNLPYLKAIVQYDGIPNTKDVLSVRLFKLKNIFIIDYKNFSFTYLFIIVGRFIRNRTTAIG